MASTKGDPTPGPWSIAEAVESKRQTSIRRVRAVNEGDSHGAICEVYGIRDGSTAAANARLIVASPDLLAACRAALADADAARDLLTAAVMKAEGRA